MTRRRYEGSCGGGDGDVRGRGGCSAVPGGVDVVVAGIQSRRRDGLGLLGVVVVVVPSRRCLDDTLIAKRQVATKGRGEKEKEVLVNEIRNGCNK